jgi:UDP-2-acetamido-2-deoxy-ribo-hexuluronate aminotransferase
VLPRLHAARRAQADRVLSLPMSADLTEADQDRVVQALADALSTLPA